MTWSELKKKAEELRVDDNMEVLTNGYEIETVMLESYLSEDGFVSNFDIRCKYYT